MRRTGSIGLCGVSDEVVKSGGLRPDREEWSFMKDEPWPGQLKQCSCWFPGAIKARTQSKRTNDERSSRMIRGQSYTLMQRVYLLESCRRHPNSGISTSVRWYYECLSQKMLNAIFYFRKQGFWLWQMLHLVLVTCSRYPVYMHADFTSSLSRTLLVEEVERLSWLAYTIL